MRFLKILFLIFVLSCQILYAVDLNSYFQYDLTSGANLNAQFDIIDNISNSLNSWFGGKSQQEVLSQLTKDNEKLVLLNKELKDLVFTNELKDIQVVNIKVSDNLLKISNSFLSVVQNSNLDYVDDVLAVFSKLESACSLIYHSKFARWRVIIKTINKNDFTSSSSHLVEYFKWYIYFIRLEPVQDEINRDLNLLSLQYMQKKIRKSDIEDVLKRDFNKAKKSVLEVEKFKSPEELAKIHKKYIEIWNENCLLIKSYMGFFNNPSDDLINALEIKMQNLSKLNCDFFNLSSEYLKEGENNI